jgi:uracil-DNA glycosylase family 4
MQINIETLKVSGCVMCDISLKRKSIVSGNGSIKSKVMIIGEAPGATEDKYGYPFIGDAGMLFRNMLKSYNIVPKELYMTNVIKCRPPSNRAPSEKEISNCISYLIYEIYKVDPILIVLLGNTALKTLFPNIPYAITKNRGIPFISNNRIILPMYHPSYVVRNVKNTTIIDEFDSDMRLLYYLIRLIYQ